MSEKTEYQRIRTAIIRCVIAAAAALVLLVVSIVAFAAING